MDLVQKFIHRYGRLPTEFDRDYLEMLKMSKYQILDAPKFKPAKCVNCGSAKVDGRKYVDIGLDLEWYGIVYFCSLCLNDIAKAAGLFVKFINEVARLTAEVQMLRDELLKVKTNNQRGIKVGDNLLHTFKEVQDYFASLPATSNDNVTSSDVSVDPDSTSASQSGIDEIKLAVDAAKSGPVKSSASARSENVRSLAELLESSKPAK